MKDNQLNEIRKENRRALPKYLLLILLGGVCGGLLGFFSSAAGALGAAERISGTLERFFPLAALWGLPVSSLLTLGGAWYLYFAAKRRCAAWDGEEEAPVEAAEETLSWALFLGTVQMLLDFFLLSATGMYLHTAASLAAVGFFLVSVAAIILLQQKVVDLERRLNPEKQGSVYDLKFQKKWLESCDEAEQKQIGQAAYKAYRAANTACPILWLVLLFLSYTFDTGLLPSFVVILLWGVLDVSYLLETIRLSRRGNPL